MNNNEVIFCSNKRNENHKMFLLILLDIFKRKENYKYFNYKNKIFVNEKGENISLTEEDKINLIISYSNKFIELLELVEKKFNGNVNYTQIFYFIMYSGGRKGVLSKFFPDFDTDLIKNNQQEKEKLKEIIAPLLISVMMLQYSYEFHARGIFDWDKDLVSYVNGQIIFSQDLLDKINTLENIPSYYKSIKNSNNNSVDEMIKNIINQPPSYYKLTITIPQIDFINDDFLNSFDGRNTNCVQYVNIDLGKDIDLKNKNYLDIKSEFKDTRIMEPEKKPERIMEPEKQPERIMEPEKKRKI